MKAPAGRGGIAPNHSQHLALDGGEWLESRPSRSLPPGKGPPVPILQEVGWAPEPVSMQRLEEKSSASVTLVVQSLVRHYTD
jgi:hypothetical protein